MRLCSVSSIDSSMRRSTRRGTRQSRRPAKRMRTPFSFSSSRPAHEQRLVEAHQVADLVGRPAPVLGREGVHGEPRTPISSAPLTTSSRASSPAA